MVFCNEAEIKSLFKNYSFQDCIKKLSSLCELAIITLGSKGSLIINKEESIEIKTFIQKEVIDTTGAGDIYAGGFIHGLLKNYSLRKCGEIGSICAGQIITQLGSRTNIDLENLIQKNLS